MKRNPTETETQQIIAIRKRRRKNFKTNIKEGEELKELRCQFFGAGIISLACSLVKEALMQTYIDSSELLKEGHKKVMCVPYCELVKTKPHRIPKGILGRLLYLKLHW